MYGMKVINLTDILAIAREMSMSYSTLYRKIKALAGMPAGEFIRKMRIRKNGRTVTHG